jgi:hypothetical protein
MPNVMLLLMDQASGFDADFRVSAEEETSKNVKNRP